MELSAGSNQIVGDNASGKSSLLEALSILSRGRSFRTPRIREVIRFGEDHLTVSGRLYDAISQSNYPLGITKTLTDTRIRINHADVHQQAELSTHLPFTIIHPDTIGILTGSPAQRRAVLDWIAFYRSTEFHQSWKDYQRILKQRNSCLRDTQQRYALRYWTEQLVRLQPVIQHFREDARQALSSALDKVKPLFTHTGELTLKLHSGFPGVVNVQDADALQAFYSSKQQQDIDQGFTLYGGHRSDLIILLNNLPVGQVASRGQLKMLGIGLLLAQSQAITTTPEKHGIIAIDDLASELDDRNQVLLHQVLRQTRQQIVITGTALPNTDELADDSKMFHVKQGQIKEQLR